MILITVCWEALTFELQALHGDLVDVGGGTHVVLPDFGVDAQVSDMENQKRELLLLSGLLQRQQHLAEETDSDNQKATVLEEQP